MKTELTEKLPWEDDPIPAEQYELDMGKNGKHVIGVASRADIEKAMKAEQEKRKAENNANKLLTEEIDL